MNYHIYAPLMIPERLVQIEKRIEKIKAQLAEIDEMRPGSLTLQYKDPASQSGARYQLSWTRHMRSRTEYVVRDALSDVRREVDTYKRFKALTEEWVDLSIERSRLKMRVTREGNQASRKALPRSGPTRMNDKPGAGKGTRTRHS